MKIYSYRLAHDYGLAPNPFWGYCTLAVCKSQIRNNKKLKIGDWVIGTGSVPLGSVNKLIYAMEIQEKLTFEDYWTDDRFQYKKPVINGSLVQMYGDNFYHPDREGNQWIQEPSAHSQLSDYKEEHKRRDLSGQFVLLSQHFYYFGVSAIDIPEELQDVCTRGRGYKSRKIPLSIREEFIKWLCQNFESGIHGDPHNWPKTDD